MLNLDLPGPVVKHGETVAYEVELRRLGRPLDRGFDSPAISLNFAHEGCYSLHHLNYTFIFTSLK